MVRRLFRTGARSQTPGSEEGRGGEEGRSRWVPDHLKKKKKKCTDGPAGTNGYAKEMNHHDLIDTNSSPDRVQQRSDDTAVAARRSEEHMRVVQDSAASR